MYEYCIKAIKPKHDVLEAGESLTKNGYQNPKCSMFRDYV